MATSELVTFLLLFIFTSGCDAWDFCRRYSGYYYSNYMYCEYGCCGTYYDQYCCTNTVGIICGAVFGGLVVIGILVGVVICCLQSKGHKGVVVHPVGVTTNPNVASVAVVQPYSTYTSFTAQPVGPPPYSMAPPPAYGQHAAYPSTYSTQPLTAPYPQASAPVLPGAAGSSTGQVSDFPPPGNKQFNQR